MRGSDFSRVCYRTEQREEHVPLRNLTTGEVGYSVGCEFGGEGILVDLGNGQLTTWTRTECIEVPVH